MKLTCNASAVNGNYSLASGLHTFQAGSPVAVKGYPGDKPEGTAWSSSGTITLKDPIQPRFAHWADTYDGESGAPMFVDGDFNSSNDVIAIHQAGMDNASFPGYNVAVEVTPQLRETIYGIINSNG